MRRSNGTPTSAGATLRCAIYTRKSSEEGLEQDFNSLHAQREACEAFVKSQRQEGWTCIANAYDDGGVSGGTLERPALRRLFTDIRAGKVNVVVVYKVDRLTRSLNDFAKIVEIFDGNDVSFVSVTQQFNTTSSMGRLTLNVLLSFAQFEREVTGERIRDKIAASKRKGMWMGGTPPLGYDVRDRKLHINEVEAETVRHIYRRYLAVGSVLHLKQDLDADGITGKNWVSRAGRHHLGAPLARGALYLLLQNRIYCGEITHKGQRYQGDHAPIVTEELWDRVQAQLASNAVQRPSETRSRHPSLLAGLLFDAAGDRMSPSHAVKNARRYRYYVSRPLISAARGKDSTGLRLPAAEIEQLVSRRVRDFLADPHALFGVLRANDLNAADAVRTAEMGRRLAADWDALAPFRLRQILISLVNRIEIADETVAIHVRPSALAMILDRKNEDDKDRSAAVFDVAIQQGAAFTKEKTFTLAAPAILQRIGQGARLVGPSSGGNCADPNASMVRLIVQAHRLWDSLLREGVEGLAAMATREGVTGSYLTRVLRLAWLEPHITRAILDGSQPPTLTATRLMQGPRISLLWREQRQDLGFV